MDPEKDSLHSNDSQFDGKVGDFHTEPQQSATNMITNNVSMMVNQIENQTLHPNKKQKLGGGGTATENKAGVPDEKKQVEIPIRTAMTNQSGGNSVSLKQYNTMRECRRYMQTLRRHLAMVRLASGRNHPYGVYDGDKEAITFYHKRIKNQEELRKYFNVTDDFIKDIKGHLKLKLERKKNQKADDKAEVHKELQAKIRKLTDENEELQKQLQQTKA